jgi:hypothetical protein
VEGAAGALGAWAAGVGVAGAGVCSETGVAAGPVPPLPVAPAGGDLAGVFPPGVEVVGERVETVGAGATASVLPLGPVVEEWLG